MTHVTKTPDQIIINGQKVSKADLKMLLAQMIADTNDGVTGAAAAISAANSASTSAANSLASANAAQTAAYNAGVSANVAGVLAKPPYLTKAPATADVANIPANGWVLVFADESDGGRPNFYQNIGGALGNRQPAWPNFQGATFGGTSQFSGGTQIRSDGIINVNSPAQASMGSLNVGGSITTQATITTGGQHATICLYTQRSGGIKNYDELAAVKWMGNSSSGAIFDHCAYIQASAIGDFTGDDAAGTGIAPTNLVLNCRLPGAHDGTTWLSSDALGRGVFPIGLQTGLLYAGSSNSGHVGINTPNPTTGFLEIDAYNTVVAPNLIVLRARNLTSAYYALGLYDSGTGGMGYRFIDQAGNTSICVDGWNNVGIGTAVTDGHSARLVVAGNIVPATDNNCNLGSAAYRFAGGFFGTAPTVSSGRSTKTNIRVLSDAEMRVAKRLASMSRIYQLCDAVALKGDAVARLHAGMIYEDVVDAFVAEKLDPYRYAPVCRDLMTTTVTRIRTVKKQRMQEKIDEGDEVVVGDDGIPRLTHYKRTLSVPVTEECVVLRDDGTPLTKPTRVSRTRPAQRLKMVETTDKQTIDVMYNGVKTPLVVEVAKSEPMEQDGLPVMEDYTEVYYETVDVPVTHSVPVMDDVEEKYDEVVPVLNSDGTPKYTVGLRYTELMQFIIAGLVADLESAKAA